MTTKEKIYTKALKMFNEQGIEYVGIRELAEALNISPGNLGYHFAKKEDLIIEVAKHLTADNSEALKAFEEEALSLYSFLNTFITIFHNHLKYRCIFISFVHLIKQYPALGAGYKNTERMRNQNFENAIRKLIGAGYLKSSLTRNDVKQIVAYMNIIGRFWIQEAAISHSDKPQAEVIKHYLKLFAGLFTLHITPKGKRELNTFLSELG